jgi:hypothetical protein
MTKGRRWALAATGVAVVAVVVGIVVLTLNLQRKAADPAAKVASPGQARQVAQALASLTTDPQSLVASGAARQVDGRARRAVPAGSTVVVDEQSWAPDGVGGGTITVTVQAPGKPPVSYATVVVPEDGTWKVLATFPLRTSKSGTAGTSSP